MTDFTQHARGRMGMYQIDEAEVLAALAAPDATTPTEQGRTNIWKRRARGGWLRVTIKTTGATTVVITVTPRAANRGPA